MVGLLWSFDVNFDDRTQANMDVVLDEICSELPHGGDHESRKFIAEQLMQAVRGGKKTLHELTYVGRRALAHLQRTPRGSSPASDKPE
jgi:hypothetical protein